MKLTPTDATYASYDERNVLEIIWQFESNRAVDTRNMQLTPKFPVLISKRDFLLESYEPVEVGISYGFDYWSIRGKEIK